MICKSKINYERNYRYIEIITELKHFLSYHQLDTVGTNRCPARS